jgi:hypothetical protein
MALIAKLTSGDCAAKRDDGAANAKAAPRRGNDVRRIGDRARAIAEEPPGNRDGGLTCLDVVPAMANEHRRDRDCARRILEFHARTADREPDRWIDGPRTSNHAGRIRRRGKRTGLRGRNVTPRRALGRRFGTHTVSIFPRPTACLSCLVRRPSLEAPLRAECVANNPRHTGIDPSVGRRLLCLRPSDWHVPIYWRDVPR